MNYTEYEGRFFVSPLIGCKGQCIYCYLDSEGIARGDIRKNTLKIKTLLNGIVKNPNYLGGKKGTIISIGAHCDIFPLYEKELIDFSIEWISEILKIGNPVQIISKNAISGGVIKRLINNIEYKNQLLYSTTITTFNYSSIIEKNTSSPFERLKVLEHFKRYGVPTNVMIKPLICIIIKPLFQDSVLLKKTVKGFVMKPCAVRPSGSPLKQYFRVESRSSNLFIDTCFYFSCCFANFNIAIV